MWPPPYQVENLNLRSLDTFSTLHCSLYRELRSSEIRLEDLHRSSLCPETSPVLTVPHPDEESPQQVLRHPAARPHLLLLQPGGGLLSPGAVRGAQRGGLRATQAQLRLLPPVQRHLHCILLLSAQVTHCLPSSKDGLRWIGGCKAISASNSALTLNIA